MGDLSEGDTSAENVAGVVWQAWEQAETAFRLARRCARIAARLRPLHERLDRVGNYWAAADRARLNAQAKAAQREYGELRQRLERYQRGYRATWRELRRIQRGWSDAEWERYRELVEARLAGEAGTPVPSEARSILEASARPDRVVSRPAPFARLLRWCVRLGERLRRQHTS